MIVGLYWASASAAIVKKQSHWVELRRIIFSLNLTLYHLPTIYPAMSDDNLTLYPEMNDDRKCWRCSTWRLCYGATCRRMIDTVSMCQISRLVVFGNVQLKWPKITIGAERTQSQYEGVVDNENPIQSCPHLNTLLLMVEWFVKISGMVSNWSI